MKCSTCGKYITKLTNKFYRKYGSVISYHPYTKKISDYVKRSYGI